MIVYKKANIFCNPYYNFKLLIKADLWKVLNTVYRLCAQSMRQYSIYYNT